jgi:hypothetical protein
MGGIPGVSEAAPRFGGAASVDESTATTPTTTPTTAGRYECGFIWSGRIGPHLTVPIANRYLLNEVVDSGETKRLRHGSTPGSTAAGFP